MLCTEIFVRAGSVLTKEMWFVPTTLIIVSTTDDIGFDWDLCLAGYGRDVFVHDERKV